MMPYSLRLSKGREKVAFLPAGYTSLLQVICPRRPTCTGNHQAADGCRLHGNCTPPRISPSCPHLLRRTTAETASTLDFMAGQEYRPHRRSWPHTEPPCDDSRCSSLTAIRSKAQTGNQYKVRSGCFIRQVMAQLLRQLLLIASPMGMYLMNGYGVVKVHLTNSPHKRKEGREFLSLYLLPHSKLILQGTI